MEQWARVPEPFSDQYLISTEGRVYSLKTNKLMRLHSPNPKQPKYKQIRFSLGRRNLTTGTRGRRSEYMSACWLVHRLMCATFYPDLYTDDCEIHHIDHDPSNNRIDNLFIMSSADHKKLHSSIKRIVKEKISEFIAQHKKDNPLVTNPSHLMPAPAIIE